MTTAKIHLAPVGVGRSPSIEVDGKNIGHLTRGVTVRMWAGDIPTIELDLILTTVEMTIEGELQINAAAVTDKIGLQIYQALRARYEGRS